MTLNIAAGSSQIIDFLYKNIYVYVGEFFKKNFCLTQKAEGQGIRTGTILGKDYEQC